MFSQFRQRLFALNTIPSAFGESRRDFSHGCIRVEDPRALAMWVLRNNPCCTPERADAAFEAQKQEQVNLAHVIPVLILYGTAIAKENGQVHFFEDTYGYDKALAKLFAQTTPQKTELPLDSPAAASFRYSACISYSALARDEEQP